MRRKAILRMFSCRILWCASLAVAAACSRDRSLNASSRSVMATGELLVDPIPSIEFWPSGERTNRKSERVIAGARLSTGEIVILDSEENQVRYFDSHGHMIRTFGRTGRGTDGFRAASWLGRCHADSVFVWDPRERRIVVLDQEGRFAREYAQPLNLASMNCSAGGAFALLMSPTRLEPPWLNGKSPRKLSEVQLSNPRGDTTGLIRPVPFVENRPLGRGTFVSIAGERVYIGTADSGFVDSYSLRGDPLGSLRVVNNMSRPPTPLQYENAIDHLVDGFSNDKDRERGRRYLRKIPPPNALPPYSGLFGSPNGTIWAKASAMGDSQTVLRGVTAAGRVRGEVHIPFDMNVLDIGSDYILGAYEQKHGEERVVLYRVGLRK
jgi:hypothetical protein